MVDIISDPTTPVSVQEEHRRAKQVRGHPVQLSIESYVARGQGDTEPGQSGLPHVQPIPVAGAIYKRRLILDLFIIDQIHNTPLLLTSYAYMNLGGQVNIV